MGDDDLPIKVDIGLSARAELKAEIPPVAMGNLVGALTDIIRPFTEARGLRADMIRLQREEVAVEIARRALARAEIEKKQLHPVPIKLLVPLLEKCSLETDDADMRERWAALLLSASTSYNSMQLTFADILSRLSSSELKIFERIEHIGYRSPHTSSTDLIEGMKRISFLLHTDKNGSEASQEAFDNFVRRVYLPTGQIVHATVRTPTGMSVFNAGYVAASVENNALQVLKREGLVETFVIEHNEIEIGFFVVSSLGVMFAGSCSPLRTLPNG